MSKAVAAKASVTATVTTTPTATSATKAAGGCSSGSSPQKTTGGWATVAVQLYIIVPLYLQC
jgi:hypothetical protein